MAQKLRCFVATSNPGKLREIIPMLHEYLPLVGECSGRAAKDAEESAPSFEGNALIKARALYAELSAEGMQDFCVIADDSGLEVDALGGAPGVLSARYAPTPSLAIDRLIEELGKVTHDLSQRSARYRCALALIVHGQEYVGSGSCEGQIALSRDGDSGFGYDPVFYVPERKQTMAQMSYELKNSFSHRRRAFEALSAVCPTQ